MLTTLKYEFMKNRILYAIFLGALAILEVVYLAMVPFYSADSNRIYIPIYLLILAGVFAFFMIFFNGISMFSRDLKSKSGYLVYMTPVPVPSILGAKILLVFLSSIIFGLGFFALGLADLELLSVVAHRSDESLRFILPDLIKVLHSDHMVLFFLKKLVHYALSIFSLLSTVYFSIALSNTLLRGKKFGGVISFVIFISLTLLFGFISNALRVNHMCQNLMEIFFGLLCFIGTSYLVAKKIDL